MGFEGNIGGGDTVWNGIIMVDPVLGNDLTGQRNVINKPFRTLVAANAVYQDGDLIDVLPGTITFTTSLVFNRAFDTHMKFREGAEIFGDFSLPLFNNVVTSATYHIHGRGEFRNENSVNYSGVGVFASRCWIHGARKISTGGASFIFGTSNGWLNIENVDEIVNERANGSCINFVNNVNHEDKRFGNVINCKKIGDLNFDGIPFGIASQLPAADIYVENCNCFSRNQITISISQGDNQAVFQNCVFKSLNQRTAVVVRKSEFNNCHFVSGHPTLEAVLVNNSDEQNMPVFNDCTFRKAAAGGPAIRTNEPASFYGVNRFVTESGTEAATGNGDHVNKNHGTILANVMDQTNPSQIWVFTANEAPPTVGETYTITDPIGGSISYTIQPADTRTELINGLVAAWDAEVLSDPTGYFAKFNNKIPLTGPVAWRLSVIPLDVNDNLPPSDGFVFTTDGTDAIATTLTEGNSFPWKGSGKFEIDEDLIVPKY